MSRDVAAIPATSAPPPLPRADFVPRKLLFQQRLRSRLGAVWLLVCIALLVGLGTRLMLLFKSAADVSWNASVAAAFAWGTIFDLGGALWWAAPLAIALAILPRNFFAHAFARGLAHVVLFAAIYILLFGAVAEWIFWDEFGGRFNFIAVDYLVYTTEVIGNIRESYPMPLIFGALFAATAAGWGVLLRLGWIRAWLGASAESPGKRWRDAAVWLLAMACVGSVLDEKALPTFANNYTHELGKSGLWSLFAAFRANQLDYEQFYPTMPVDAAFKRVHDVLGRDGSTPLTRDEHDLLRLVRNAGPEQALNVIQITVESLSANFLERYGDHAGLTPNLNALVAKSLVFDQLYATGTRTDRGMEALTLSVPPTPGRSLVKRPFNEHLFTLGSVFRSKGYETTFIYGGYGYFDNMNHFFGENGYRVVDRTKVAKSDITFANVWGACDEDLFRWTLREADNNYAAGKPFFHFVMTTSNHRPFTFPDGKIDLLSKISGRAGGVKYTDYAIGELLRQAATKPWFKHTIFVIVADHCASSAGKAELPVQNYHIPMLIYAPGRQIKSGVVNAVASQADYAPTLLGLLGWSYPSRFMGSNVLQPEPAARALIGNYQKLGLLSGHELAVLKPVRQATTYHYDEATQTTTPDVSTPEIIDAAIAYYQTASFTFKHGKQGEYAEGAH
jgi:phosphoglycerol transferase MdoB-like AlkP superfamily enzyme